MIELLGQGEDCRRLLAAARARRMHHGVLIAGPRGAGKSTAAELLASALLCGDDAEPDGPCGRCPACRKGSMHPDLHRVEVPEDKDEIPVDLVRELRDSLARLPVEGRARVVILDPADRLNFQGQNALLKTLEEPGRDTYLLLVTARPEALLDTVRSRVTRLQLRLLDDVRLDAELRRRHPALSQARRQIAVGLAAGSLGQAQACLAEGFEPLFTGLDQFVRGAGGTPVAVAQAALDGASGRVENLEQGRRALWILRTICRKELRAVLASGDTGAYSAATSVQWTALIESLLHADTDLDARIPPEQVLVRVLLAWPRPGAAGS